MAFAGPCECLPDLVRPVAFMVRLPERMTDPVPPAYRATVMTFMVYGEPALPVMVCMGTPRRLWARVQGHWYERRQRGDNASAQDHNARIHFALEIPVLGRNTVHGMM